MAVTLKDLEIELFADCADKTLVLEMAEKPWIRGFTTNPSLMKLAGVTNYPAYARDLIAAVPDRHISFEVFSDDIPEIIAQARAISRWGPNVYVKLPVTTTCGEALFAIARELAKDGIRINLTAIFSAEQAANAVEALADGAPGCVSIFAGRLADAGIEYRPIMRDAIARARSTKNVKIIWASTREIFNIIEANEMRCHIITAPTAILKKLPSIGTKGAAELSLDAVKLFHNDALAVGLTWHCNRSRG